MQRITLFSVLVLALALGLERQACAQARTGTSNGLFGSRSVGGSTSSLSSGSRLGGGTGGGAGGGTGVGAGGTTGGSDAGSLSGDERFVRGNRQAGSFVGGDQQDVGRFVGGSETAGGGGQMGGQSRIEFDPQSGGLTIRQDQGGRGGRGQQRPQVRVTRQIAFDYTPPPTRRVGARLATRLDKIDGIRRLGSITVEVRDRTAILRGVVPSDRDRALAEQVALLEAGISRVENNLTLPEEELPPEE